MWIDTLEVTNAAVPRTRRTLVAAGFTSMVLLAAACAPPPPPPPPPPEVRASPTVVVYGDSLVSESRAAVSRRAATLLPGWRVVHRDMGGTAQCDWHGHMVADVRAERPKVVVIAFSGNLLTDCATARPADRVYVEDAAWAVRHWRANHAALAFVGAPPRVGSSDNATAEAYRSVADTTGTPFFSSTELFVSAEDQVAHRDLACLSIDADACADDVVQVRNDDGAHLCPTYVFPVGCLGYASGAERYADVIANAAAELAGLPTSRLLPASPGG